MDVWQWLHSHINRCQANKRQECDEFEHIIIKPPLFPIDNNKNDMLSHLGIQIINFFNGILQVTTLYCLLNSHAIRDSGKVYVSYITIRKINDMLKAEMQPKKPLQKHYKKHIDISETGNE